MGIGIGISVLFVIVSLLIAWRAQGHKLGQAVFYMFVGLILAAIAPGTAQSAHDFLTNSTTSVQHIDPKK